MDLDSALTTFDKVAVNLEKLEKVWERAHPHVPNSPSMGTHPEYTTLARNWLDLLPGLPPIDGWRITEGLPDINALGQAFLDYAEIGVLPRDAWAEAERPGEELATYRHLLDQARRRVIASRLTELSTQVTELIRRVVEPLPALADLDFSTPSNRARIESAEVDEIEACLTEIERLLGQTVDRQGRWGELRRHLRFGQPHDWHEISTFDWPSVQSDIEAAKIGETDPVPVPDIDLGRLSETKLTGQATTGLAWKNMDDDGFERLLFDLLGNLQGYRNVQWLSRTNAADRGRDLSLDRVLEDGSGDMRVERVIVQAKHYTSKSVSPIDVHGTLASLPLWGKIDALIIATSSRFTSDAIALIDQHNNQPNSVRIEMWPDSKLEVLLGPRPTLAITHKLRD